MFWQVRGVGKVFRILGRFRTDEFAVHSCGGSVSKRHKNEKPIAKEGTEKRQIACSFHAKRGEEEKNSQ